MTHLLLLTCQGWPGAQAASPPRLLPGRQAPTPGLQAGCCCTLAAAALVEA
jgi:hypothetical protein